MSSIRQREAMARRAIPAIEKRLKANGGEIHWGDEIALVNTDIRGRGYASKGQTQVALALGSRQKLSMISTVTNQGRRTLYDHRRHIERRKVHPISRGADQRRRRRGFPNPRYLRVHHSKIVKTWQVDAIEVFYCRVMRAHLTTGSIMAKNLPGKMEADIFATLRGEPIR